MLKSIIAKTAIKRDCFMVIRAGIEWLSDSKLCKSD